jgi:hypothetical protein
MDLTSSGYIGKRPESVPGSLEVSVQSERDIVLTVPI